MYSGTHRGYRNASLLLFDARKGIISNMLYRIGRILDLTVILIVLIIIAGSDTPRFTGSTDRVRVYTREIEFDYPNWTWRAAWIKIEQAAINTPYLFSRGTNKQIVYEYFRVTGDLGQTEARIEQIYADPNIIDKETVSAFLRAERDRLSDRQKKIAPYAESVIQDQVSELLAELGLTTMGQPVPPVLYQISRTPLALIVSPRSEIRMSTNISVLPTLTINEQIEVEDKVAAALDVSTLTVPTGGIGVYPTMVMETTNLPWTISTTVHEWAHNYLGPRPLGRNYINPSAPELHTMNETTANIVGDEVGHLVLQRYYPELLASNRSRELILFNGSLLPTNTFDDPPPFDFRAEMYETRVKTDELLAEGKIEEAEAYMETRRQVFWQNGYLIRKLNQAFFAFNGAYADVPGGAAGEDPVGPAVRTLREQSASLAEFINTIARMTSFEQLQAAIQE